MLDRRRNRGSPPFPRPPMQLLQKVGLGHRCTKPWRFSCQKGSADSNSARLEARPRLCPLMLRRFLQISQYASEGTSSTVDLGLPLGLTVS